MIFQANSTEDMTAYPYSCTKTTHQMSTSQLKIVSFNIWDLPYWFVKNRRQRILQIAEYLQSLDAEIVCLQESFDVHHRRLLYEHLGLDRYYASGGFEETRKVPFALFDTTGGLVIFSKFPIMQYKFIPFNQFTPSLAERIGRKGVLEATIETPYGVIQVFNIHLHMGGNFLARSIRVKQLKSVLEHITVQRHGPVILAGDFNENVITEQKKFVTMLQSIGAQLQVRDWARPNNASKMSVDRGKPKMQEMVETVLTPPHPDPLKRCWMSHLHALSTIPPPSGSPNALYVA